MMVMVVGKIVDAIMEMVMMMIVVVVVIIVIVVIIVVAYDGLLMTCYPMAGHISGSG